MNSKSTKILLVEDNPADARYTKELLPATQYSLIGANSLAEALECVRDTRVDVVLLDLALPDSMGVETVAKLIAQRKELPIVVLTGLEDVECAIEALRIGAHDYIVKGKLNEELLIRSIDLAIEAKKHQLTRDNLLSKTRLNKLSAAVGEALITCHSVTDFLEKCAEALHQHLGLIHAHIWTLNDHLNEIHLQAVSGECKDMKPGSTYVSHQTKNLHQLSTEALAEITDLLAKKTIERCEINSNKDWAAVLVVEPLISDDRLFGFLTLHMQSNADTIPQPSLKILAEQIAMGLDKKLSEAARALLANIVQCSEDGIIRT
ncbi:MAG TPA: response regulator, partial [Candidatus Melainabacteria bacterium]|nr:response regulator [Candidatus Melainabacteria bacterium]